MGRLGIIGGNFGHTLAKWSPCPALVYDIVADRSSATLRQLRECSHVIVATPNETHFDVVSDCIIMNFQSVLCLKPFVFSHYEIDELFNWAEQRKLVLKVGFNNRFRNEFKGVRASRFQFHWYSDRPSWQPGPFHTVKWDLGIHLVDLVYQLCPNAGFPNFKEEEYRNQHQTYRIDFGQGLGEVIAWYNRSASRYDTLDLRVYNGQEHRVTERGNVEQWKDSYTFTAMIRDFMDSTSSDDPEYLKKINEVIAW